ncbi:alpha/beta hydrolase [Shimazuella sp. AN120528]|uniref:alpha/beta fold hydrolase n=1 Tax=Shimazuella soli TaxID=1892854 RepID=UPI001F10E55F|nr:alpha/beta hydrolase [Shimazuella soli]MCH5586501.1 alpha/beta hydrolase [Shimazuella soli]
MPTFAFNNATLYFEEEGQGSPLILLHGLTQDIETLVYEREFLKPYFRVISLDARGHGKSSKLSSYTLQDHVQDVIALMDHLGIEKASVMGNSLGSYIAQGVTVAVPHRVEKLVLVVPKAHGKTSSMQEMFHRYAEELVGMDSQQQLTHLTKYMFYDPIAVGKALKQWEEKGTVLSPEQQVAANKALEGFDYRPELHKVEAKTLVISGQHDGLNPPERGKEVASFIPNATFVLFEKSGHAPVIEEKDRFKQVVTDFLTK